MSGMSIDTLKDFFDQYVNFSWTNDFQFGFWKIKLDEISKQLTTEEIRDFANKPVFFSEGIFATYDIPIGSSTGWLNVRNAARKAITKETVIDDKNIFLQEIINLSIVRYQNALERLLTQAINEYYIKIPQFDVYDRTCCKKFFKKMGIPREDNSQHLLTYLESKNLSVKEFLVAKCNIDLNASWKELFDFFGLIRNIIVHNGMLMPWNKYEGFLSIQDDAFHFFFEKPNKAKLFEIRPRLDRIGLIANYSDQFATNIIKRIANKNDLEFLDFSPC